MKLTRIALALLIGGALGFLARADDLPDPTLTPGVINPDVTADNIASTICVSGWTKTIRPPASYTNKLKAQQMKDLGMAGAPKDFEEDHRVPLEVGGNPTDPRNLYPEAWAGPYGAHAKDRLETSVKKDVCAGRLTLDEGRAVFLGDWRADFDKRFRQPH